MTVELIKQVLNNTFQPTTLEIIDNSATHAGHSGARKGGGHYQVTIISSAFIDKSLVQRHQLIYQALSELMKQHIHALSIHALSPSEQN